MSEFTLLVQTRDPDVVYQEIECTCPGHIAEMVLRAIIHDHPKATAISVHIKAFVTMPPLLIDETYAKEAEARRTEKDKRTRWGEGESLGRHPVTSEPEETVS